MTLILLNGSQVEVDTSTIFNNQYITKDGKRIYDTQVRRIIDDVRLGEFYCSANKQGSYEEVAKAIAEERQKINQCDKCWWWNEHTLLTDDRQTETVGDIKTVVHTTTFRVSCGYKSSKRHCAHDIDDVPKLFRDVAQCFFCLHPEGVPDMTPFKQFLIDHANKYNIVSCYSDMPLSVQNSLRHNKTFGSYKFYCYGGSPLFILENCRNRYRFLLDFTNHKFILCDSIGYQICDKLSVCRWDCSTNTHKNIPIVNFDKFAQWIWGAVDDFLEDMKNNPDKYQQNKEGEKS